MTGSTGIFREIGPEMCDLLREIAARRNDSEIRLRKDGTYDVFELEKKKRRPAKAGAAAGRQES